MKEKEAELRKLLSRAYAAATGCESDETTFNRRQYDFAFHMTDWLDDFEKLAKLYAEPEGFSVEEAQKIVQDFLYHASGHIVAAARLYDAFLDPFGPAGDRKDPG